MQESPGGNLPPEPAIRAEATIPGKNVQLRMTIKRNADQSLPASHIIEMIFLTPEGFPGGGIDNILRVAMKGSEQEAGNPLIGIPAKIADGFFLVALNDSKAETDANLTLLRRQAWIDIPVVYKSGRRALFTMEKGIPGDKVFDEALKAGKPRRRAEPRLARRFKNPGTACRARRQCRRDAWVMFQPDFAQFAGSEPWRSDGSATSSFRPLISTMGVQFSIAGGAGAWIGRSGITTRVLRWSSRSDCTFSK